MWPSTWAPAVFGALRRAAAAHHGVDVRPRPRPPPSAPDTSDLLDAPGTPSRTRALQVVDYASLARSAAPSPWSPPVPAATNALHLLEVAPARLDLAVPVPCQPLARAAAAGRRVTRDELDESFRARRGLPEQICGCVSAWSSASRKPETNSARLVQRQPPQHSSHHLVVARFTRIRGAPFVRVSVVDDLPFSDLVLVPSGCLRSSSSSKARPSSSPSARVLLGRG